MEETISIALHWARVIILLALVMQVSPNFNSRPARAIGCDWSMLVQRAFRNFLLMATPWLSLQMTLSPFFHIKLKAYLIFLNKIVAILLTAVSCHTRRRSTYRRYHPSCSSCHRLILDEIINNNLLSDSSTKCNGYCVLWARDDTTNATVASFCSFAFCLRKRLSIDNSENHVLTI